MKLCENIQLSMFNSQQCIMRNESSNAMKTKRKMTVKMAIQYLWQYLSNNASHAMLAACYNGCENWLTILVAVM